MSASSIPIKMSSALSPWRQRLFLSFIVACFVVPLAAAWLLVGRWRPDGSVQHGELLNPARPLPEFRFAPLDGRQMDGAPLRGHWMLVYVGSAAECAAPCQTALYDLRQVRLALGKDMARVKTLLLLDGPPDAGLQRWLAAEHPTMNVGIADAATRTALAEAFNSPGQTGAWVYLLDPLGNLLMRYAVTTNPRGMLEDLQRLLRLSRIG